MTRTLFLAASASFLLSFHKWVGERLIRASSSGGNQRDLARAKAQKKQADASKGKRADGLSVEQRKARDAEIVKQKQMVSTFSRKVSNQNLKVLTLELQQAKEAEKAAGGGTGGGGGGKK